MVSCMISLWFTKGFSVVQTKNLEETVDYVQLLLEKVGKESEPVDYVSTLKIKKKDKLQCLDCNGREYKMLIKNSFSSNK